jgi:hypothetical protein
MSIWNDLDRKRLEINRSGVATQISQSSLERDKLAWDLSSQDYDSDWGQNFKIFNPLSWVQTWQGVVKNNSIKNPDATFLEQVRDNVLGYTGGMLKGAISFTSTLEPIVKGGVLSAGVLVDEFNDNLSGHQDKDTLFTKLNNAWDISKTTERWSEYDPNDLENTKQSIGLGEALLWTFGRAVNLFAGDEMDKAAMISAGIGFAHDDFDIFTKEDSDTLMSGVGSYVQWLNFVGEIGLDWTGPAAAIARPLRLGFKAGKFGKAGDNLEVNNLLTLAKKEEGVLDNTALTFINGSDEFKTNWLKSKGLNVSEAARYKILLDTATNPQEWAEIMLAIRHNSQYYQSLVAKRLGADELLILDGLNEGGTLARTHKELLQSGRIVDGIQTDEVFAASFLNSINKVIAKLDDVERATPNQIATNAEALSSLRDLSYKVVGEDSVRVINAFEEGSEILGSTNRELKRLLRKSKTYSTEDGLWKSIQYNSSIPGIPTIVKLFRSGGRTSSTGKIDLVNELDVGVEKIRSMIADLNDYTKGALATSGKTAKLNDDLTSALAKENNLEGIKKVFDDIQELMIEQILIKRGVKRDAIEGYIKELSGSLVGATRQIENGFSSKGRVFDSANNTVYIDDAAKQAASEINDFTFFTNKLADIDMLTKGYDSKFFENLFWLKDSLKNGIYTFNHWWSTLILARGSRFPRERLANLPGYIISGNLTAVLLGRHSHEAIDYFLRNTAIKTKNIINGTEVKQFIYKGNYKKVQKNLDSALGNVATLVKLADDMATTELQQFVKNVKESPYSTQADIEAAEIAEALLQKRTIENVTVLNSKNPALGDSFIESPNPAMPTRFTSKADELEFANALKDKENLSAVDAVRISKESNTILVKLENESMIPVDEDWVLRNWDKEKDNIFSINKNFDGSHRYPIEVYGREVNLDNLSDFEKVLLNRVAVQANFKDVDQMKDWFKSKHYQDNNCGRASGLMAALSAAGIGTLAIGGAMFTNPSLVGAAGKAAARRSAKEAAEPAGYVQRTANENYIKDLTNKQTINELDIEAADLLRKYETALQSKNSDEIVSALEEIKDRANYFKQAEQQIKTTKSGLQSKFEKQTPKKGRKTGTGRMVYNNQNYNNFAEGNEGIAAAARINLANTYEEIFQMHIAGRKIKAGEISELTGVYPGDPDYYNVLGAYLQMYGRGDTVFEMLARGDSAASVIDWLRSTNAGRAYAEKMKIGNKYTKTTAVAKADEAGELGYHQGFEEFIQDKMTIVNQQLFTPELTQLFNSGERMTGEVIEQALKTLDPSQLPPIAGHILQNQSVKSISGGITKFFKDVNRLLVEQPQQILENLPSATVVYNREMAKLIDENIKAFGRDLTVAEINNLEKIARAAAIKNVRKWFYNVQSQSNIAEALSLVVPFISAYTFTIKMLMRGLREKPAETYWFLSGIAKTIGGLNWVDQNGEPTDFAGASGLVIPLDDKFRETMKDSWLGEWLGDGKELRISRRSLDVWFGGEVIPGPGALVTIPTSEFVKGNPIIAQKINEATKSWLPFLPNDEGIIDYILQLGPSKKPLSTDFLLPTWINNAIDAGAFTNWINPNYRGEKYMEAYARVLAYESVQARLSGPNADLPTSKEIEAKVNALYGLKFISSFLAPAAMTVRTDADLARQIYRQYLEKYGTEEADWRFMVDHPDLISGMVSVNSSEFGLSPDIVTVQNLDKQNEVVDILASSDEGGKDMLGFFMNTSGQAEFDEYAWTYLNNKGPTLGSTTYYNKLDPIEVQRKALAKMGWVYFNKINSAIDAEATTLGVNPETDERLKFYRKQFIDILEADYPEWAAEYNKRDTYRYTDRVIAVSKLLSNEQFLQSNDPEFIEALNIFISNRNILLSELQRRSATGGAVTATAKSNQDLLRWYDTMNLQLKTENLRFADFYNRFFINDTLRG